MVESSSNNRLGMLELNNDPQNPEMDAPVAALRPSSQTLLSTLLNPIKVIPTETGLPRDWRGLAELAGVTTETISYLQSKVDPTAELIKLWCKSADSQCKLFSDLKAFLAVIDRFDVADDVNPLLEADRRHYQEVQRNGVEQSAAVLDPSMDKNILTIEDSERVHKNLPLTRYDAFILYADEDAHFADQVIDKMEKEYGLKLCVKDRDLLPGVMFEHEVIGRLIEERCNRFLVIFSPNFLKSTANHFLLSYAQASALESRVRKIVPCMYEMCELPPSVRYCFSIKYNRAGRLYNFWEKLSHSLRTASAGTPNPSSRTAIDANLPEKLRDPLSDESLKWWDAEKPTLKKHSPPPSYSKSMEAEGPVFNETVNDNSKPKQHSDATDTFSIRSDAHLLSSEKSKKWYQKLKSPIKKKKEKNKAYAEAEALVD